MAGGDEQKPPLDLLAVVVQLFRSHGIAAQADGDRVIFPGTSHAISVDVTVTTQERGLLARLDARFLIHGQRSIDEAFVGVSDQRDQAIHEAIGNFCRGSLHVLIHAFFAGTCEDQIETELWEIGGIQRRVTLGPVLRKAWGPLDGLPVVWFDRCRKLLKESSLGRGEHWLRFYHARMDGRQLAVEVLLDNQEQVEWQRTFDATAWEDRPFYYSERMFLVIQDA